MLDACQILCTVFLTDFNNDYYSFHAHYIVRLFILVFFDPEILHTHVATGHKRIEGYKVGINGSSKKYTNNIYIHGLYILTLVVFS